MEVFWWFFTLFVSIDMRVGGKGGGWVGGDNSQTKYKVQSGYEYSQWASTPLQGLCTINQKCSVLGKFLVLHKYIHLHTGTEVLQWCAHTSTAHSAYTCNQCKSLAIVTPYTKYTKLCFEKHFPFTIPNKFQSVHYFRNLSNVT